MDLHILNGKGPIGYERGASVICVPLDTGSQSGGALEHAITTVRSVLLHTEETISLFIVGSEVSIGHISSRLADDWAERSIIGVTTGKEVPVVGMINIVLGAIFPADAVLIRPGVSVADGWFEGLRDAALSDSIVASATALSDGTDFVTGETVVPDLSSECAVRPPGVGCEQIPGFEEAALTIRQRSLKLRPRIPTIGADCLYLRRAVLELVGQLDDSLSLNDALAAIALDAIALGMVHVAADNVLVDGHVVDVGNSCAGTARVTTSDGGMVRDTICEDESSSLRRARNRARVALAGMSVTIDGRALGPGAGGTQTYIIGLILALARVPNIVLRVLVAPNLSERAADALATVPHVGVVSYEQAIEKPLRTDVVHRPQQVFTPDDLTLLRMLGERVVVTQQDLIAYHNFSYHSDVDAWRNYRRTTRLALAGSDQVIFFSEHGRRDALAEDLLPSSRTHVVGIGADSLEPPSRSAAAPEDLRGGEPFLLCLGADYAHKNRPFAIKLLGALRESGWGGRLVFAGAHIPYGASSEVERVLLADAPDLAANVVELGPIDEATKQWLYEHACAMVYPTLYEGFGLLPVEAGRVGLPCLFAAQAALSEVAGSVACLVPWDPRASAVAALPLLSEGPARKRHIEELRAVYAPSWSEVVEQMREVYEQAIAAPASEAAPHLWQELERENYIVKLDEDVVLLKDLAKEYQDAYHSLHARVEAGLPLIDKGGLLSRGQQRGLMRVAAHHRLSSIILKPFDLLGRVRND
jgi:glycosyltransferase involved in cell wall biosynthesis